MWHHWLTQFTCVGLRSWCEREARKNKNPTEIKTWAYHVSTKKCLNLFLSNNCIHKTTCEDLFSEHLKNLLLTVLLTPISCFWMTSSWLCEITACKLWQKEPYSYFFFFFKRLHCNSYTEHFSDEALQGGPLPGQTQAGLGLCCCWQLRPPEDTTPIVWVRPGLHPWSKTKANRVLRAWQVENRVTKKTWHHKRWAKYHELPAGKQKWKGLVIPEE